MSESEHQLTAERKSFGFWVYLMTDCVLFASLFITFVVLMYSTAGGPSGSEIFDLNFVLIETLILLISSVAAGVSLVALSEKRKFAAMSWLVLTFVLGIAFLVMEITEFSHLISEGYGANHSAFLSAFYTLVGTHGLHITVGLLWLAVLGYRLVKRKFKQSDVRRLSLWALFWHFLDVIWIFIFSVVYMIGGL